MQSKAVKQALKEKEMYDKGLITKEEYDTLRGYERRGSCVEDPEWKAFFNNLPKVIECFLDKGKVV